MLFGLKAGATDHQQQKTCLRLAKKFRKLRQDLTCRQLLLPVVLMAVWCCWVVSASLWSGLQKPIPNAHRFLLVTAHPDDETIFFSPTISALRRAGREVYLLCLSTGNAYGLGPVRTQELKRAGAALRIDEAHLMLLDHDELQDGKDSAWNVTVVGELVHEAQLHHNIDTIITFDKQGITSHPNHLAVHEGVRNYMATCWSSSSNCPTAWELVTHSKHRKSLGGEDSVRPVAPAPTGSNGQAEYVNFELWRTFSAMFEHKSQSKWWGHILTTKYALINAYQQVAARRLAVQ